MPHPATVKRQAREARRRFRRVLAELERNRAPIRTERQARWHGHRLAFAAGFACAVLVFAFIALTR